MGFFKKAKKFASKVGKRSVKGRLGVFSATADFDTKRILASAQAGLAPFNANLQRKVNTALGLKETSPGKFTSLEDIAEKKDLREITFNQIAVEEAAQKAKDEEEKRRRRRGNIGTRPLGALVSNSLRTRVLTGQ